MDILKIKDSITYKQLQKKMLEDEIECMEYTVISKANEQLGGNREFKDMSKEWFHNYLKNSIERSNVDNFKTNYLGMGNSMYGVIYTFDYRDGIAIEIRILFKIKDISLVKEGFDKIQVNLIADDSRQLLGNYDSMADFIGALNKYWITERFDKEKADNIKKAYSKECSRGWWRDERYY